MTKKEQLRMRAKIRGFFSRKVIPFMIAGLILLIGFIVIIYMGFRFSATWQVTVAILFVLVISGGVYAIAKNITKKLLK